MENKDALSTFFQRVIDGLRNDAQTKGQKFPVSSLEHKEDNTGGQLIGADYIKYLIFGRSPGKFPPPDKMLDFVESNPEIYAKAKEQFRYITEKGLAFLIGRKLAREGSDIYQGKKQGIDFLGVMEKNMPELLKALVYNEALSIATNLKNDLK